MIYKRYYSPLQEPNRDYRPISPSEHTGHEGTHYHDGKNNIEVEEKPSGKELHNVKASKSSPFSLDFLNKVSLDDIIILCLIVVLLMEEQEERDVPLILGLGFLFLIEYIER